MRSLGHDGKRLDAWKTWTEISDDRKRRAISNVLHQHVSFFNPVLPIVKEGS
jgi:hypothetical protein